MIGDAGLLNDDSSYTGDVSSSPLTLDYYRTKALEFQQVLNALDSAYMAASDMVLTDISPELSSDLLGLMAEYTAKKSQLKLTAEAINAGAAVINGAGGRFPELSIPGTLGVVPFVLPAAAIAAIGAAVVLATWGVTWIGGVNDRLKRAQLLEAAASPEQRAALANAAMQADNALTVASGSVLGDMGGLLKWGVIAAIAFMVWKTTQGGARSR